jgi:hypothetical protein
MVHSAEDGSIPVPDMSYDERAKSIGLRTIDTAPRDGTAIIVTAEDEPLYEMSWNQFGSNDLVQAERGIWWGKDGAFTWSEKHGHGPTHWAPLDHPMVAILKAKAQGEGNG